MDNSKSKNDHLKENLTILDVQLTEFLQAAIDNHQFVKNENVSDKTANEGDSSTSESNIFSVMAYVVRKTHFVNELCQYTATNEDLGLKTFPLLLMMKNQFLPILKNGELSDESIGSGQQGEVYTLQKDSGGFDAVKVMLIEFETIEQLIRDNNELEKLLYFRHKNVIPIIDSWSVMNNEIDDKLINVLQQAPENIVDIKNQAKLGSFKFYLQMPHRPMTLEVWIEEYKEYEAKREQNRSMWSRIKYFFGFGSPFVDDFVAFRSAIIKKFKQHFETYGSGDAENYDKLAKSMEHIMENWDHNEMIFNVFYQLLKGFHFLHTNGIVHGDVHPRNIFIGYDENGELHVELGDFGLACEFSTRHTGKFHTNPDYASPEQLSGERHTKNDLYCLGVILLDIVISSKPSSFNVWKAERGKIIEDVKGERKPEKVPEIYFNLLKTLFQGKNAPNEYLSGIPKEYLSKWTSNIEEDCLPTVSENAKDFVRKHAEDYAQALQDRLDWNNETRQELFDDIKSKLEGMGVDFNEFRGYF